MSGVERISHPNIFEQRRLLELRSRPLVERVERLEQAELVDRPEAESKLLAEIGACRTEIEAMRKERAAESTLPKRIAAVLTIAITTAAANLVAQWGLPQQHQSPAPVERRGP